VDYLPWPEIGCCLAEARRRTADCKLAADLVELERGNRHDEIERVEKRIDAICLDHLKSGRLIAYAFSAPADKQLIAASWWKAFTRVDWQNSLLMDNGSKRLRSAFTRLFSRHAATTCLPAYLSPKPLKNSSWVTQKSLAWEDRQSKYRIILKPYSCGDAVSSMAPKNGPLLSTEGA
jgi:hypothetical protein